MKSKVELKIDWVSERAARYACQRWHYSKTIAAGKKVHLGVWENGKYIGAVVFGHCSARQFTRGFGLKQNEAVELLRVALKGHVTPVTRIISIAIKILRKRFPTIRLMVSYADQNQQHIGVIYQAGNWIYVGEIDTRDYYKGPDGKVYHPRVVSSMGIKYHFGKKRKYLKYEDCERVPQFPKHKYLYPFDKEMKQRVLAMAKPYPKKISAGSIDSDASGDNQPGEGGATPTSAL